LTFSAFSKVSSCKSHMNWGYPHESERIIPRFLKKYKDFKCFLWRNHEFFEI
jgi:hypothetical protein